MVVSLHGSIDLASASEFLGLVDEALDVSRHVVFDMDDVTFLDSTGLRVIAIALRRTRDRGSVVMRNADHSVLHLLHATGMDQVLAVEHLP